MIIKAQGCCPCKGHIVGSLWVIVGGACARESVMCVHVMDMYAGCTVECKFPTGGSVYLGDYRSAGMLRCMTCRLSVSLTMRHSVLSFRAAHMLLNLSNVNDRRPEASVFGFL